MNAHNTCPPGLLPRADFPGAPSLDECKAVAATLYAKHAGQAGCAEADAQEMILDAIQCTWAYCAEMTGVIDQRAPVGYREIALHPILGDVRLLQAFSGLAWVDTINGPVVVRLDELDAPFAPDTPLPVDITPDMIPWLFGHDALRACRAPASDSEAKDGPMAPDGPMTQKRRLTALQSLLRALSRVLTRTARQLRR